MIVHVTIPLSLHEQSLFFFISEMIFCAVDRITLHVDGLYGMKPIRKQL